jgi:DNA (cytosine-5)-methyltransferase 1
LKYLSVCSGIEAASVAWHPLGWQPVAFSEIEPFPSAVLAHHYPNVPNLGDMTKFTEWPDEPVDLLVGGTPCQSFSVAGLRKGLEDPRGNLMLTYLAIAQRYRPRWLVWENVPGVLSSNGGRDFGTFLGALGELGYGWAYRVLDAQWFGVAQRRRRVFVVGHLGDWQRAAQVLFERESVRRDSPPSREARQGAAAGVGGGVNERGTKVAPHIFKVRGGVEREDGSRGSTNIGKQAGKGYLGSEERAFTLAAAQDQFVAQPVAFHANAQACQLPGPDRDTSISDSLTRSQQAAVAQPVYGTDCYNGAITGDVAATLGTPGSSVNASGPTVMQPAATAMQVRRLTPVECERLQGFPDGYTNIPWRKKPEAPDGPRYKALGNSMAVPCMAWIGKRIAEVDRGD